MAGKRRLYVLAALFMMGIMLLFAPLNVRAEETENEESIVTASGIYGNITWKIEDGKLTLTGSGVMTSCMAIVNIDGCNEYTCVAPWKDYAEQITAIEIDDRFTTIGDGAFEGLENATGTLELPGKLTKIGENAFMFCSKMDYELDFPSTLTSIGMQAFHSFGAFNTDYETTEELVIPATVKSLGEYAFAYSAYERVYINNASLTISAGAFEDGDSNSNIAIYAKAGSTADKYATANGHTFYEWDYQNPPTAYTVTFDSNGGSAVASASVEIGGKVTKPAYPTKTNQYFQYWTLNGEIYDFDTPVRRNITLKAVWSKTNPVAAVPLLTLYNGDSDSVTLNWQERIDGNLLRWEIYRADNADAAYQKIASAATDASSYKDTTVSCFSKLQYCYKIKAIYETADGETSTPFSNVVSCNGMMWDYFTGDTKGKVREVRLVDDKGNEIKELTLKAGEDSPELHLELVYVDGSVKDWRDYAKKENKLGQSCFLDWKIYGADTTDKDTYRVDSDIYAKYLPTLDYLGLDYETSGGSAQIRGRKVTEGKQMYIAVQQWSDTSFFFCVPITIVAADDGAEEDTSLMDLTGATTDAEFWESIREGFRNRKTEFYVLYERDAFDKLHFDEETYMHTNMKDEFNAGVFDFCAEREGMKSGDGDYLMQCVSSYQLSDMWPGYYGEDYFGLYISNVTYYTTKEQEAWMDDQIDKMVNQPGGRFYAYKNAGDYDKVKAVYDFVCNQMTWVNGSNNSLYHMAYSGLHDGKGTCQSYALLFYRLARELGVPNKILMGTDAGAHTYNIVKLGGKYYYLDCSAGKFLKGSKNFSTTKLQWYFQDERFIQNYTSKISTSDYGGSETSELQGITALTDDQVKELDSNMLSVSDKMKATYTIKNSTVTVKSTTLAPVYGCTGYAGYEQEDELDSSYYLAMRIKADGTKFTSDGKLSVEYTLDGENVSQEYTLANSSTLSQGYVDVIIKLKEETPAVRVTVDYDTAGEESEYRDQTYTLDISGIKRSDEACGLSEVKEAVQDGIASSSPMIVSENAGADVTVSYQAVAYSEAITSAALTNVTAGNYIALKVPSPETMKGTAYVTGATTVKAKADNGHVVLYVADPDGAYVMLYAKMTTDFNQTVTIAWAGKIEQKITIKASGDCRLETLNEDARAPKSVKFNGLVKTLYTGQSATADVTIVKQHERDEIQLSYATSDSSVLTINRVTGEMQALKPGSATITVAAYAPGSTKAVTASAKITVKSVTAPSGLKTTELKDTSVTVNWKKNETTQEIEFYAIPFDTATLGKDAKTQQKTIEAALAAEGMDRKLLSSLEETETQTFITDLSKRLGVSSLGNVVVTSADAAQTAYTLNGLSVNTQYVIYVRSVSQTAADEVYAAGALIKQFATRTEILTKVTVQVNGTGAGEQPLTASDDGSITITAADSDKLSASLTYQVVNEGAAYTSVAYKSTNDKVLKVNNKGVLTLGKQAGTAQLYVTGKDSSGAVRESDRITVRVIRTPSALADKSTTLTLGSSVVLKDLIGYNTAGSTSELTLDYVDYEEALSELQATNCFHIERADGQAAADAVLTAVALVTDNKGKQKSGNSIKISFKLYDGKPASGGKVVSEKKATIKINDMAQPSITKVTATDRSVTVKFKPSASVMEPDGTNYYYLAELTDKVTGKTVQPASCTVTEEDGSTAKVPLYTCVLTGLSAEKDYEIKVVAVYDPDGKDQQSETMISKASAAKKFKTLKRLAAEENQMEVSYISLPKLRNTPDSTGTTIDAANGITIYNNETYVLMAQVDDLTRVLGTDKLKWTITSSDVKNPATLKAGSDTYQAQLTTMRTGTFTVTVTSTVSKQTMASFTVTVLPYQSKQ